jgi:hypothetical protein
MPARRASIEAGRRVLTLAGLEPRGFVAPAYAYTPALRRELALEFEWWGTPLRLVGRDRAALSPALSLRRSPLGVRAANLNGVWHRLGSPHPGGRVAPLT